MEVLDFIRIYPVNPVQNGSCFFIARCKDENLGMGNLTNQERMISNLRKTMEIIDTVFALKLARVRATSPEISCEDAERAVNNEIISRKERQWKSQIQS